MGNVTLTWSRRHTRTLLFLWYYLAPFWGMKPSPFFQEWVKEMQITSELGWHCEQNNLWLKDRVALCEKSLTNERRLFREQWYFTKWCGSLLEAEELFQAAEWLILDHGYITLPSLPVCSSSSSFLPQWNCQQMNPAKCLPRRGMCVCLSLQI